MSLTWEHIQQDWLGGGQLALSPEVVVDAFNRVEDMLGREWIERLRTPDGTTGTAPTLRVVTMGQMLASLDGVLGTKKLLASLRRGDASARAELMAIHLAAPGLKEIAVELEPSIIVEGRHANPDFRARHYGGPWTYVEVTQPDSSDAQRVVESVLQRLTDLVLATKKAFALEIFLRREPTEVEIEDIRSRVEELYLRDGVHSEDLAGLGSLFLNYSRPGEFVIREDEGEEKGPRLFVVSAIRGPHEPHRHIGVTIAFADDRAEQFVRAKARQMPNAEPGLIMVNLSSAAGGFTSWEPLIRRRFQPNIHTRVSAICLFESGLKSTGQGMAWIPRTKLLVNPHAKHPLPSWIADNLARYVGDLS